MGCLKIAIGCCDLIKFYFNFFSKPSTTRRLSSPIKNLILWACSGCPILISIGNKSSAIGDKKVYCLRTKEKSMSPVLRCRSCKGHEEEEEEEERKGHDTKIELCVLGASMRIFSKNDLSCPFEGLRKGSTM